MNAVEDRSARTLATHFAQISARFGSRPALMTKVRYHTEHWSYTRLSDQADRVACALLAQGIAPGDRVVLWGPNSLWWVAAYFGCLRVGAILVPLDMLSAPDFVGRVLEQTEPALAIVSRRTGSSWEHPAPVWYLEDLDERLGPPARPLLPALDADHPAEILFTSGTTGVPKGVILTHANLLAEIDSAVQVSPPLSGARLLSLLPLSHMLEQMGGLLLPLTLGAGVFYPASRRPTLLMRDLFEQRITAILGVPQIFDLFMKGIEQQVQRRGKERAWRVLQNTALHLPMATRRLLFHSVHACLGGRLEFVFCGGAPLDPELMRKWEALGIPMLQAYGTTEASPALTTTTLGDRLPGSVGKPVPGVSLRLGEDGEVLAKGGNITPGYWRDPRATAAAFQDGWYRTGDLGYLDERGHLFLRGRKKHLIVRSDGLNVYPEDLETALLRIPGIKEAVVLELPGSQAGQVHAVLRCEDPADAGRLIRLANLRLAPHQQIQAFTVWPYDDFPRTHTMKIRKDEVVRTLLEGSTPVPAPLARPDSSAVRRLVAACSSWPLSALEPDMTLGELGFDSLARVELLAAIERECGVYLDETEIDAETTVGALEGLAEKGTSGTRPTLGRWQLSPAAVRARDLLNRAMFRYLNRLCPETVSGTEHLQGLAHPAIFVANHTSGYDVHVMLRALSPYLRRRIAVVTADKYFNNPLLGAVMVLFFNSFRFVRQGNIRPTLEHAAWLVDQRWSLILFPEGTRSATGEMAPFKPGIALLAVELGVPVVPLYLDGMFEVLPRQRMVPRPGSVRVQIGAPLRFAPGTPQQEVAEVIESSIRRMKEGKVQ